MSIFHVIVLAVVQGLAELLPVSSSAHVVVAEKLMGLDPSSPQMTLLLVMLHTGTMFAVIVYFWNQWKRAYFSSSDAFQRFAVRVIWATALTGVLGELIKKVIEKTLFKGAEKAEIEQLFGRLDLIAPALLAAGILILIAGLLEKRQMLGAAPKINSTLGLGEGSVTMRQAGWMGAVQGLALPFRGFSRSGSTISAGMLVGASKERAERFSFALAVVLTPAVVGLEALRLVKASHEATASGVPIDLHASLVTSLLGMVFSFFAGLVALRWLSSWLEQGRWYLFGIYCIVASFVVFYLHHVGY
ncbi:undecaprenyl-diphosphate phosphatase [Granulicella sp. dw_53]|uniref:undecaprenyl-diphosphate phosphatase n=1 Tax=Granulicella sp. dw_53 TaxID=2719792 RepID=UPI001BD1C5A2|nr:undecaprenyl-diphosphate phosphatase [Granulicella sp. dw_53]